MSRQRWFCCLCGAMTARAPAANGRALCTAHSAVALDTVPPDPLESLPVMAQAWGKRPDDAKDCYTTGLDMSDPATIAAIEKFAAQYKREAATPPTGTED